MNELEGRSFPTKEQFADIEVESERRFYDWSLEDVLDFSDESRKEQGAVEVYTACSGVQDGNLIVRFSEKGGELTFDTDSPDEIFEAILKKVHMQTNIKLSENEMIVDFDDLETRLKIVRTGKPGELSRVIIEFNEFSKSWLKESLGAMGLESLLKNHDIPEKLTPEYVDKLIGAGEIKVGKRIAPVVFIEDVNSLRDDLTGVTPGVKILYHGASLSGALSILRVGLFSESPGVVRPILSSEPNVLVAKLAKNEWSGYPREDESGYGAIVVFRVNEEDVISHGFATDVHGRKEELFQPAKSLVDGNEVYRLQRNIIHRRMSMNNPGYLDPQKVEKIVLLRQSQREVKKLGE